MFFERFEDTNRVFLGILFPVSKLFWLSACYFLACLFIHVATDVLRCVSGLPCNVSLVFVVVHCTFSWLLPLSCFSARSYALQTTPVAMHEMLRIWLCCLVVISVTTGNIAGLVVCFQVLYNLRNDIHTNLFENAFASVHETFLFPYLAANDIVLSYATVWE